MVKEKQCQVRIEEAVYNELLEYCRLSRLSIKGLVSNVVESFLLDKNFITEKLNLKRKIYKGDDSNGVKIPQKDLEQFISI